MKGGGGRERYEGRGSERRDTERGVVRGGRGRGSVSDTEASSGYTRLLCNQTFLSVAVVADYKTLQ